MLVIARNEAISFQACIEEIATQANPRTPALARNDGTHSSAVVRVLTNHSLFQNMYANIFPFAKSNNQ